MDKDGAGETTPHAHRPPEQILAAHRRLALAPRKFGLADMAAKGSTQLAKAVVQQLRDVQNRTPTEHGRRRRARRFSPGVAETITGMDLDDDAPPPQPPPPPPHPPQVPPPARAKPTTRGHIPSSDMMMTMTNLEGDGLTQPGGNVDVYGDGGGGSTGDVDGAGGPGMTTSGGPGESYAPDGPDGRPRLSPLGPSKGEDLDLTLDHAFSPAMMGVGTGSGPQARMGPRTRGGGPLEAHDPNRVNIPRGPRAGKGRVGITQVRVGHGMGTEVPSGVTGASIKWMAPPAAPQAAKRKLEDVLDDVEEVEVEDEVGPRDDTVDDAFLAQLTGWQ